jgi:hypothetical protein
VTYAAEELDELGGTVAPPTCDACSEAMAMAFALVKSSDSVKTTVRNAVLELVKSTKYAFAGTPEAVSMVVAYPVAPGTSGTAKGDEWL